MKLESHNIPLTQTLSMRQLVKDKLSALKGKARRKLLHQFILYFSGLPNEVDFAINVCCILSMEGSSAIKFLSHCNLLHLLIAHVGLFSESSTLQALYHNEWFPKTKRNFTQVLVSTLSISPVSLNCIIFYSQLC